MLLLSAGTVHRGGAEGAERRVFRELTLMNANEFK